MMSIPATFRKLALTIILRKRLLGLSYAVCISMSHLKFKVGVSCNEGGIKTGI